MSEIAKALRECFINQITTLDRGGGESTTSAFVVDANALANYIEALERVWLEGPSEANRFMAAEKAGALREALGIDNGGES